MTLEESILAYANSITVQVYVGGVLLSPLNPNDILGIPGCLGYQLRKDIETKDPVCDLYVNFIPDWILDGMEVKVFFGYDGFTIQRFTGTVQNLQHSFGQKTIECHGVMWLLVRQLDAPDIVVDGLTVDEAITQRLQFVGITNFSINVSPFVLGSVVEAKLPEGQTLDQVAQLLDVRDGQLYELGNGQIIGVGEMYYLPAPTSFRQYTAPYNFASTAATVRILDGSDRENPDYFRDHILATGASIPDGDPLDPDTVFTPVKGEVSLLGASIRQPPAPPGVFATQPLSNDLIDTLDEIDAYAQRKLTKFARIPRYLSIEQVADPRLEVGMTLNYDIGEMRVTGNWFVAGFTETVIRGQGARQTVDLTGGSRFGGSLAQNPHAAFTYTSILQSFGGVLMQITTLDGSGSHAGDGTITAWDWTGDFTGSGERLVIMFNPDDFPDGPSMTLTVTSSNTLTDDQTQTINKDPTNVGATPIDQPSVWYSADISLGSTPDAGASWNDLAATAGQGVDTKPNDGTSAGIAIHGDGDRLIRTTDFDLNSTVVWAGGAGDITYVWWDKLVPTRCWAATKTGAILLADADGLTVSVYRAQTGYPVWALATPQGPQPSLWAFGGRGDQPDTLVQYNIVGDATWTPISINGLAAGSSALTVAAAASRIANELMIGLKGELSSFGTNVLHTDAVFTGSNWSPVAGLDGKVDVRFVVPDFPTGLFHVGFGADTSVWNTAIGDPLNFTETPNVFPAGYEPNQCLWEGDFLGGLDGIFLIAVENATGDGGIMKNVEGFLGAADWFRGGGIGSWPVGAKCKSISIGVGGEAISPGILARLSGRGQIGRYSSGSGLWTIQKPAGAGGDFSRFFHFGDHWFYVQNRGDQGDLFHSPDGVTFTNVLPFSTNTGQDSGVHDIMRLADGRFLALRGHGANTATNRNNVAPLEVYISTDGVTWTLLYSDAGWTGSGIANGNARPGCIAAHPTDSNKVLIALGGTVASEYKTILTTNLFGSVTRLTTGGLSVSNGVGRGDTLRWLTGSRLLHLKGLTPFKLQYSDSDGATWTDCTLSPTQTSGTGREIALVSGVLSPRTLLLIDSTVGGDQFVHLYATLDGITWTRVGNGDTDAALAFIGGSLVYDEGGDIGYLAGLYADKTVRIDGAALGTAAVVDITSNYDGENNNVPFGLAMPR